MTCALGGVEQVSGWNAERLDDTRQLIGLILAGEQWTAGQQFAEDARHAPDVYRRAVPGTEDHLGRTVEPRLNVCVDALMLVTARTEVDHLPTAGA